MKFASAVLLALFALQGCDHASQRVYVATTNPPATQPTPTVTATVDRSAPPARVKSVAISPSQVPNLKTADTNERTLVTKNFVVTITDNRPEGEVTWNDVKYYGISRNTGQSLRLTGSDWHNMVDADGTPGRFMGYVFKSGNVTYQVLEQGRLRVVRGNSDVLVDEPGTWLDSTSGAN
jgi:hypothetical protein